MGEFPYRKLGTADEAAFQQWIKEWSAVTGKDPNPDDPRHFYDYRSAYEAGVTPKIVPEDGQYHWDSRFKADDHPHRFVDGMDTKYNVPQTVWPMPEQTQINSYQDLMLDAYGLGSE